MINILSLHSHSQTAREFAEAQKGREEEKTLFVPFLRPYYVRIAGVWHYKNMGIDIQHSIDRINTFLKANKEEQIESFIVLC